MNMRIGMMHRHRDAEEGWKSMLQKQGLIGESNRGCRDTRKEDGRVVAEIQEPRGEEGGKRMKRHKERGTTQDTATQKRGRMRRCREYISQHECFSCGYDIKCVHTSYEKFFCWGSDNFYPIE